MLGCKVKFLYCLVVEIYIDLLNLYIYLLFIIRTTQRVQRTLEHSDDACPCLLRAHHVSDGHDLHRLHEL